MGLWQLILSAIHVAAATAATIHAVLRRRDSRAVIAWVGLVWLAPLAGSVAYACLGVNRIYRKAASLNIRAAWTHQREIRLTRDEIEQRDGLVAEYPNLRGLVALGRQLSGRPVSPGNEVEVLVDGDQAYPAMLAAIESAEKSITLLTYIFDSDRIGEQFLERLVSAHRRGVAVRVLIDDVGARYSRPTMLRRLSEQHVPVASFLPTRTPRLFKFANLRNHRKILVVDGKRGFTGGTNIREGHCLKLKPAYPVQCVHFQIHGPVVASMQEVFAFDWAFASGESLSGDTWFPPLQRVGGVWARGISDGPDEDFELISDTMLGGLAAATESVRIVSPYFLPDAPLIRMLNVTAMRGVDVKIVMPAVSNIAIVQWAAMAQLWQLLEKNCRIYLSPPPFDHTKLMVVDDIWSLIGSSNWDPRSLRLNFEFNVECYDRQLGSQLRELIEGKIRLSHELTMAEIQSRPLLIQLRDGLARLLTPYL
jgi:cardiolipin synthase